MTWPYDDTDDRLPLNVINLFIVEGGRALLTEVRVLDDRSEARA